MAASCLLEKGHDGPNQGENFHIRTIRSFIGTAMSMCDRRRGEHLNKQFRSGRRQSLKKAISNVRGAHPRNFSNTNHQQVAKPSREIQEFKGGKLTNLAHGRRARTCNSARGDAGVDGTKPLNTLFMMEGQEGTNAVNVATDQENYRPSECAIPYQNKVSDEPRRIQPPRRNASISVAQARPKVCGHFPDGTRIGIRA